ncbi:MAG: amidohydrolase family protein, partial [Candidatus Aminicenantaceae bacterium]
MKGRSLSAVGSVLLILGVLLAAHCAEKQPVETIPPADLVLTNASVYTMDPDMPTAAAVAVTGTKITAVCQTAEEAQKYIGDATRVIDLQGAFVTPGIIDGHVHFNRSGELINDANLMTVSDEEGLRNEIARIVEILDDGEWITAGLWGAYEQWALSDVGEKGGKSNKKWRPHRDMIDELSPNNPSFLCRFDYQEWLAN